MKPSESPTGTHKRHPFCITRRGFLPFLFGEGGLGRSMFIGLQLHTRQPGRKSGTTTTTGAPDQGSLGATRFDFNNARRAAEP